MISDEADDLRRQFRRCGDDVTIAPGVVIEHPEVMEVGDRVRFMSGVHIVGRPSKIILGDDVTFQPGCFVQGGTGRLQVADRVDFYLGTYLSLGEREIAPSFIDIGSDTHFAPHVTMYGWGGLTIGTCVNVAAGVVLATVGHHHEDITQPMAFSGEKFGPITVGHDVWLGANATVTADVTIASGCVIGANAVVTRDTDANGIYGGVPARRIGERGK